MIDTSKNMAEREWAFRCVNWSEVNINLIPTKA